MGGVKALRSEPHLRASSTACRRYEPSRYRSRKAASELSHGQAAAMLQVESRLESCVGGPPTCCDSNGVTGVSERVRHRAAASPMRARTWRNDVVALSANGARPASAKTPFLKPREWVFVSLCGAIAVVGLTIVLTGSVYPVVLGWGDGNPVFMALYGCLALWPLAATLAVFMFLMGQRRLAKLRGDDSAGRAWLVGGCAFGALAGAASLLWMMFWAFVVLGGGGLL